MCILRNVMCILIYLWIFNMFNVYFNVMSVVVFNLAWLVGKAPSCLGIYVTSLFFVILILILK